MLEVRPGSVQPLKAELPWVDWPTRELISRQTRRDARTQSQRSRPGRDCSAASRLSTTRTRGNADGGHTDTTTLAHRSHGGSDPVLRDKRCWTLGGQRGAIAAGSRGSPAQAQAQAATPQADTGAAN